MTTLLQRRWFKRGLPAPKRGPQVRLAAPMTRRRTGLRFTEILVLFTLGVAYLESVSQPVFGIQLHLTLLNHFPLALLVPALALHLMSLLVNRASPPWAAIFSACWPLVLLACYALVGSSIAKWELTERDTFLTFAVYLLLLPLFAAAVPAQPDRLRGWALALVTLWLLASLAALTGEAARYTLKETLHEIEYMVTVGFFVTYYAVRVAWLRLLVLLAMAAALGLNNKLTGYIVGAMALLHILVSIGWRRLPREWRAAYGVAAAVFTAAVVAALTMLYFTYREYLPSGNVAVRLSQYQEAWRQFLASPLWGNAYLANSGEAYTESFRVLNIPTHSDVLDILKHGGLIGLALFCWGYGKIFLAIHRAVAATESNTLLNAYFVGLRFFQVTALVTFAINPILLKGPFLIVIWGNLGIGLGMALTATRAVRER